MSVKKKKKNIREKNNYMSKKILFFNFHFIFTNIMTMNFSFGYKRKCRKISM